MLKNKIWIVALFVALTIGFIGCTDAAFDWVPPVEELEDNALQVFPKETWAGVELNHAKFNFAAGDIIVVTGKALAANTIHISNNHQGWNPIGATGEQRVAPDEEFEIKATLTKADVTSIAGLSPAAIRIYGRTANATFIIYNITVTRGGEEFFNFYEMILKDLKPGTTGAVAIFGEKGANTDPTLYRSEAWMGVADGESNAHDKAVYTVLGKGYGGSAAVEVPTYKGDPTKVEFIKGTGATPAAAALNDKVIDHDPSITGDNVTINADGTAVGITTGSVVHYKFPAAFITGTGKKAQTNPLDLEVDYDNVEIEYTISGVVTTSNGAGNFKGRLFQYESTTSYGNKGTGFTYNGDGYADFGGAGNHTGIIRTWGAGGKAGFTIGFNQYDISTSGCDSLNLKINKVTFTKGNRYTVTYVSPQTGYAGSTQTVLNGLPPRPPTVSLPGWTFLGWFDRFNQTSQNTITNDADIATIATVAIPGGVKIDADTVISANTTFYAAWLRRIADPIELSVSPVASPVETKNFIAREGAVTFAYDSDDDGTDENWFVFAPTSTDFSSWADTDFAGDATAKAKFATIPTTTQHSRISLKLDPAAGLYSKITVSYELVLVSSAEGGRAVAIRKDETAQGGNNVSGDVIFEDDSKQNATPWLNKGTGSITLNLSQLPDGWFGIAFGGSGKQAALFRVTKVEYK